MTLTPYLDWLSHSSLALSFNHTDANNTSNTSHTTLTNTSLRLPNRIVSPEIMRGLVTAIKQQRRIDVNYVSLSNPDGEGRIIQPHIFVKTGLRWHLRAYDEKHKQFRDFVLSRFRGCPEIIDSATHNSDQDQGWHTFIELVFAPDTRLNSAKKKVIEQDYQMTNGQLVVLVRAALAQYLIQEMQVNIKFHDELPEAQQLVLVNKHDIKQWLFNA